MRFVALAFALGTLIAQRASAQDSAIRDGGATIDPHAFRYARPITTDKPGLTTITLDAAALAHSSLNDLRIATADGHQVPYLIERLGDSLSIPLPPPQPLRGKDEPATRSIYLIRLPYSGLPASRLVIRTDARVFTREVRLEALPPADEAARVRSGPMRLETMIWRNDDPERAPPPLVMTIPALRTAELRLVVDEGDNAPLALRAAALQLSTYRLRFYQDGSTQLVLLYGQPELPSPRYDLALLAPRIREASAQAAVLGPESNAVHVTGVTPTIVFWCALGLAVLVLLVLISRLLRPNGSPPATTAASSTPPTSSATPATGE